MTVPIQDYRPVGTLAVELSVASVVVSDVVTTIRVHVRSRAAVVAPTTFITDNSLEAEVVSRAGMSEDTTLDTYTLVRTDTYDDSYVYVLDVTVS
jgi:hypothetical protein